MPEKWKISACQNGADILHQPAPEPIDLHQPATAQSEKPMILLTFLIEVQVGEPLLQEVL